MQPTDLRQLYLAELQEAQSFEEQIAETFSRLAEKASDAKLRQTFDDDISESKGHAFELSQILAAHGMDPRADDDRAMHGILAEADRWAGRIGEATVRDAALIASAQRVQHYEIAVYGSLASWAQRLGFEEVEALQSIAEEEKAADIRLTRLAERQVNRQAAA